MANLPALTLKELIQRLRMQLRRWAPSVELEPDEARNYINLAYLYYLMRLGIAKETDLIVRQTAVNIVAGTHEYALPAAVLLVTSVVVVYQGYEYYLYRSDPKAGIVQVVNTGFPQEWGWTPKVSIIGRKVHLLPVPPMSITGGLVIEGTTLPTLLSASTDTIDAVLHPSFHPLIELKSTLIALKSQEQEANYTRVEKMLTEFEGMFDVLTANRTTMREIVEDAGYMEV